MRADRDQDQPAPQMTHRFYISASVRSGCLATELLLSHRGDNATKTIAKLVLALGAVAAMSYGETWSGKLLDAACYERSQKDPERNSKKTGNPPACEASTSTASFALATSDGKVYKLDSAGNSKAATALRGNPDNKSPEADVSGTLEGQILKVDSISVR